jgi:hypothetical protein
MMDENNAILELTHHRHSKKYCDKFSESFFPTTLTKSRKYPSGTCQLKETISKQITDF